jgi:hypothetical protein
MKEDSRAQSTQSVPARIAEDRAAKILERAAALDAKRNSEIEIDQLREAAEDAGISREAFEEALREQSTELQVSDGTRVAKGGRREASRPQTSRTMRRCSETCSETTARSR